MESPKLGFGCVLVGLALAVGAPLFALSSENVPRRDPIYRLYERLESYNCLEPTLRLMKPASYRELRQGVYVKDVQSCVAAKTLIAKSRLVASPVYRKDFVSEFLFNRDFALTLNGIDAQVLPLFPQRGGRAFQDGAGFISELEFSSRSGATWGLAFGVRPMFHASWLAYQDISGRFSLYEWYVKGSYKKIELGYGRQGLEFGDTRHGSLLLSSASAPIDAFRLRLIPHRLPLFGLVSFDVFYGFLGKNSFVSESKLLALSLSVQPSSRFQLGVLELYQFGGVGGPSVATSDILRMLAFAGDPQKTHKNYSIYSHLWFGQKALKTYTQLYFSQLGPLSGWFADDISFLVGLYSGRLLPVGVGFELVKTTPNAYQSATWAQGLSHKRTPLGHPLGRDALGLYLDLELFREGVWEVDLTFLHESRIRNAAGALATETRWGIMGGAQRRWVRTSLRADLAFHSVINARNVLGSDETQLGMRVSFSYQLL